jgi:CheY-like chemotaxis protein
VLIVDDYPGARYRRMRLLLDAGAFDVAEESLGRDAVRRVAQQRFDLVVVDLHLPDISGVEVVRGIRAGANQPNVPILMMSAVSESADAARLATEAGATAYLGDSADGDAFLDAVRHALG